MPPDGHWILGDEGGHKGDLTEVSQLQVQILIRLIVLIKKIFFFSKLSNLIFSNSVRYHHT